MRSFIVRLCVRVRWRVCPLLQARCNKMCVVEHHLLYLPKVFSVGYTTTPFLIWLAGSS